MKFFDFEKKMIDYPVFTAQEVKAVFYDEENILEQLAFWENRGYLERVEKGLYVLSNKKQEIDPMVLAGKIYRPSYLSLEFALNYYGIIPDIAGVYTSVTSRKTNYYCNDFGKYIYQKVKNDFFTGYVGVEKNGVSFNLATPEKAVMDYLYLNKDKLVAEEAFWKEMRIDEEFKFRKTKIEEYKRLLSDKKVDELINSLLKYQKNAR
jgi:predicted transcriptional regulator of viral defense system